MDGVSRNGGKQRRREYNEDSENNCVEDLSKAEMMWEKNRTLETGEESSETCKMREVSTTEMVKNAIEHLWKQETEEENISRRMEDALEDLEKMERTSESIEDRLRDALENLDEEDKGQNSPSEWEKDVLEDFKNYDVNLEDVKEQWKEKIVDEAEFEIEESSDEPSVDEKKESEPVDEFNQRKIEDKELYYDDGSGLMYSMKLESSEYSENRAKSETTKETQEPEQESADISEKPSSKKHTEPQAVQSEGKKTITQEEDETEKRLQQITQESIAESEPVDDVTHKEVEYQREMTKPATTECSDEAKNEHNETSGEKKIEVSTEHELYRQSEDVSEDVEDSTKQESKEETTESEPLDEHSPEGKARKRVVDEIFSSFPEEIRESFRKYLEDLIEDEDDFEELVRRHGLENLLEEDEVTEEIREFLRFKKTRTAKPEASIEELVEELEIDPEQAERWTEQRYHPEALKKVLRFEGYRILDNLIRKIREQSHPVDLDEFEEFLQRNPRLEFENPMAPFEQWKREARAWIEIVKAYREGRIKFRLRHGWEIYNREQIEGFSERYGVSRERIISWLRGKSVPYIIVRFNREINFRKQNQRHQLMMNDELHEIRSRDYLIITFKQNPKMFFKKSAKGGFQRALVYCDLMSLIDSGEDEKSSTVKKFAEENKLHRKTVSDWIKQKKKPTLIRELEKEFQKYNQFPGVDISESTSNQSKFTLSDPSEFKLKKLFKIFRLCVIDLKNINQSSRNSIINFLKLELEKDEIRYGVVNEKLIVWKHKLKGLSLNSIYKNQYYFFSDPHTPLHIIREAVSSLGLEGTLAETDWDFRKLVKQLTSSNGIDYLRSDRIRISGSTMNLLCDILGKSLRDFEVHYMKIGGKDGHGGIYNPAMIEHQELEIILAGLFGVVVSDCHVRLKGGTTYYESNLERIESLKKLMNRLGDIQWGKMPKMRNRTYELWLPSIIDSIIRLAGIPAGDRTILNHGLPIQSRTWSTLAKIEYMKQMFAQESNIDESGRITWTRSHVLSAGKKAGKYKFETLLSPEAMRFLAESDEMKTLSKKEGYERIRERYITMGRLKRLKSELSNPEISQIATEILNTIKKYRNRLIDDEIRIIQKLGIMASLNPLRLSYHVNSGRVSINWGASIDDYSSKIRCALMIPPSHPEKARTSMDFLLNQPQDEIMRVKIQLKDEGFIIEE
ncbi:MAG: hypothetical protein AM326_05970 [Candidatus Thorarchaeota archaeon SMTZ-45]|nr:MAG: hypothetical protein AM325_01530 [Candidatus Thorarchaeota archaeon SMTZ1-45]KXH77013.1 MAG: hypothetical protein AM326_05970 [Candidatus Thorarchaeota archaeon SMTZ-45]